MGTRCDTSTYSPTDALKRMEVTWDASQLQQQLLNSLSQRVLTLFLTDWTLSFLRGRKLTTTFPTGFVAKTYLKSRCGTAIDKFYGFSVHLAAE